MPVTSISLMRAALISTGLLTTLGACTPSAPAPTAEPSIGRVELTVAAASDLSGAFRELATAFEAQDEARVRLTFGSSGMLSKQVLEGAPFELFASANAAFADEVIRAGRCSPDSRQVYAQGRIAIWSPGGGAPATLQELADPRYRKIAIANPEHAPYGAAAKEALVHAGVFDAVADRLVFGENVSQALQFAESGNAEAAIVALSLAIGAPGEHRAVDAALHRPLLQVLVTCGSGPREAAARRFAAFVAADEGRDIMRRYGFFLPGEAAASAR